MKKQYAFLLISVILITNYHSTRSQINAHEEQIKTTKYALIEAGKTGSGPVEVMPWEDDPKFVQLLEGNGTEIFMAGYKTVLRDPLPGEEENVHLAADMLSGTVVKPGEIFSQNMKIGPYTESRGFKKGPTYLGTKLSTTVGGGVCKVASTLYNVAVLSNLGIVERHHHAMPVPYVPYGQDATVYYGGKDFRFKNTTDFPITIWAKGIENSLYIGFYGSEKPPRVQWHHEVLGTQKARVIYIKNSNLLPGEEKTIVEAMDGLSVKSWITIEEEGKLTVKEMGISDYAPLTGIVEINH